MCIEFFDKFDTFWNLFPKLDYTVIGSSENKICFICTINIIYYIMSLNKTRRGGGELKNRIKDLREDHDLTQTQLAAAIGITQRKYSYVETGTQPLTDELLVKLADYYNVSIDYLLRQTDDARRYR